MKGVSRVKMVTQGLPLLSVWSTCVRVTREVTKTAVICRLWNVAGCHLQVIDMLQDATYRLSICCSDLSITCLSGDI